MKTFTIEYDEAAKTLSMNDTDGVNLVGLTEITFSVGPDYDDIDYCNCEECTCEKDKPKPEIKLFVDTNYNKKY